MFSIDIDNVAFLRITVAFAHSPGAGSAVMAARELECMMIDR